MNADGVAISTNNNPNYWVKTMMAEGETYLDANYMFLKNQLNSL